MAMNMKELVWQYKAFIGFALVKPILGLALLIQGIIMIAYSPPPCEDFDKCPFFVGWYCKGVDGAEPFHDRLDAVPANYGFCGLALGLGVMLTGACSFLVARKQQKRWMVFQMVIDIAMCATSAILSLLCSMEAANLEDSCEALKKLEPLLGGAGCEAISQMIQDLCDFVASFQTFSILFFVLCVGVLAASILDCMALCCCQPVEATNGAPPVKDQPGAAVVGVPEKV